MSLSSSRRESKSDPTTILGTPADDDTHSSSGLSFRSGVHAPASRRQQKSRLKDFTVNRLRFGELGLVGREEEVGVLGQCFERTCDGKREMVFLSGHSGSGKSSLAKSLESRTKQKGGVYISGKFDCYQQKPYAGIASACRELCGHLISLQERDSNKYQAIQDQLQHQLGMELGVLTKIPPEIKEIISNEMPSDDEEDRPLTGAKNRTAFAFQRFLQTVCAHCPPLVMVLDDLQWADPASLEVLQSLITNSNICNFLVVGCYRSEEVEDTHLLSKMIRELPTDANGDNNNDESTSVSSRGTESFQVTHLTVDNLDVSQISNMLAELLSVDVQDTRGLANICHKKTHGNVFFLIAYLSMLQSQNLLEYNLGAFKWTWKESEIESQTSSTENVVSIVKSRMEDLTDEAKELLQIGACLGSSFEGPILTVVWRALEVSDGGDSGLRQLLDDCTNAGLLETAGLSGFRFVHDNIQQAALSLIDQESLQRLKAAVAKILVDKLDPTVLESQLFVAVNLLNGGSSGSTLDEEQQIMMAEFNLKAARKAQGMSAFESASGYAQIGIGLLPSNKWTNHYQLALDLYSTAAEMQGMLGFVEQMEGYCNEVLGQMNSPLSHKFRVYNVMQSNLLTQKQPKGALDLGLDVLTQLNCRFPERKYHILFKTVQGIVWAKRGCKSFKEIAKLPRLADPEKIEAMQLMDKCSTACYLASPTFLPLLIFKRVKWSLKYGLCLYSPPAFGDLGLLFAGVLKDFQSAEKIADYTLKMLDQLQCRSTTARTLFVLNCFVLPWVKPALALYKPLLTGYHEGMATGDTLSAMYCVYFYILLCFQSGKKLELLEADCETYTKQMRQLKTNNIASWAQMVWDIVLILKEKSSLDTESVEKAVLVPAHKNQLYTLYGHHQIAADLSISRGDSFGKEAPGHLLQMSDALFRSISCFDVARKTKNSKYKKEAKSHRAKIKSWIQKGNPNVSHYNSLLDAENAALKGQTKKAIEFYEKATLMASRAGFLQDAALAHERYGEFMLQDAHIPKASVQHFKEAHLLYTEWGALGKAEMIQQKYGYLWPNPEDISFAFDQDSQAKVDVSSYGSMGFSSIGDLGSSIGVLED